MSQRETQISNLQDLDLFTENFSQEVLKNLQEGKDLVILLHGSMAAGKTTLISSLAKSLKVPEKVTSPSFTGIHEYSFFDLKNNKIIFYHLDLYQVNLNLDAFLELMDREEQILFAIEWSEKLEEEVLTLLTNKDKHISILDLKIKKNNDTERLINYGYRKP